MENITMTIDATHLSRVRSVCPEAGRVLLAGTRGWVKGIAVSAPITTSVVPVASENPTFRVGYFGATIDDFAFRPFGEPPV
jgi:hypothetical protein